MSAAPPTESALAPRIDLELVGVAAAVLDYSHAAERLRRLAEPLERLEDPWVVHELAATVTCVDMNRRAAAILGVPPEIRCRGRVFSILEEDSELLETFKTQFVDILKGSLTSRTEQRLSDHRIVAIDWKASDTSYRNVVVTLSDVTSAKSGADKRPLDVNAMIATTVAAARNEWNDHCEVALDLDAGLPPVPALAGPLEQAILGIVVNAAQAVGDAVGDSGQKGTIAISTTQRGDNTVLKITDSGVGIPTEIQHRIFDPFLPGRGLTICRSVIVEQHGGTLDFETEPGVGTTFSITLPLHIEEDIS